MAYPEIEQTFEEFMNDIQPYINQGWVWRDCRPFLKEIDRMEKRTNLVMDASRQAVQSERKALLRHSIDCTGEDSSISEIIRIRINEG